MYFHNVNDKIFIVLQFITIHICRKILKLKHVMRERDRAVTQKNQQQSPSDSAQD